MSFYQKNSNTREERNVESGESNTVPLLITLEQNIQLLKRKTHQVGTHKDSRALRDEVSNEIIPKIQKIIRTLSDSTSTESQDKFMRDFQALMKRYNEIKAEYETRAVQHLIPEEDHNSEQDHLESQYESMPIQDTVDRREQVSEETPLLLSAQQQEAMLNQDELDFHTIIQHERAQDISKIHSAVQEVNAIFKQLGTLVQEQGDQVDTIGENVVGLSHNVQNANKELNKANEYQKKKNRCRTIVLVAIIIITLITLIATLS